MGLTLGGLNQVPFLAFLGIVDGSGQGRAVFQLAPGLLGSVASDFGALLLDPGFQRITGVGRTSIHCTVR
jgi:hypothetical protein